MDTLPFDVLRHSIISYIPDDERLSLMQSSAYLRDAVDIVVVDDIRLLERYPQAMLRCTITPDNQYQIEAIADRVVDLTVDIQDYGDFSRFRNLRRLNCHHNRLTSSDVRHCPLLENLNYYLNRLTSLDVTQCPYYIPIQPTVNIITRL